METWTQQPGFPLVTFVASGTTLLTMSQSPFIDAEQGDDAKWIIPVRLP